MTNSKIPKSEKTQRENCENLPEILYFVTFQRSEELNNCRLKAGRFKARELRTEVLRSLGWHRQSAGGGWPTGKAPFDRLSVCAVQEVDRIASCAAHTDTCPTMPNTMAISFAGKCRCHPK